ncbi:hypothetical protein yrohd0001_3910 [Yersinia rohdei ATCC 43380]|nr:hypothetical protein yrohd0001_3910 [Yersinia rohdei ATCC 43380]
MVFILYKIEISYLSNRNVLYYLNCENNDDYKDYLKLIMVIFRYNFLEEIAIIFGYYIIDI